MDLLSSLRRRWVLACSLFLLALAGTAYGWIKLPSTYQSTSSVVLLAPKNATKTVGGNPYLAFNSSLNMTGDVVRYETNDSRTVELAVLSWLYGYLPRNRCDRYCRPSPHGHGHRKKQGHGRAHPVRGDQRDQHQTRGAAS